MLLYSVQFFGGGSGWWLLVDKASLFARWLCWKINRSPGYRGSCLCKGPWHCYEPFAGSFVCMFEHFCMHVCFHEWRERERERERGKLSCHISSSNHACAKEQSFILNLLEIFKSLYINHFMGTWKKPTVESTWKAQFPPVDGGWRAARSPQCSWSVGVTDVGRGPRFVTAAIRHDF